MSEDFFGTPAAGAPVGGDSGPGGIPDMDALFEESVNQDSVRQTQQESLNPSGSYTTAPTWTRQVTQEKDSDRWLPAETHPAAGRLVIRLFGMAEMTVTEKNSVALKLPVGTVARGFFSIRMSPHRAFSVDRQGNSTGKPDNATKLWAQAVTAYRKAYNTTADQAVSIGAVVKYVEEFPTVIQVRQFGVPTKNNPEPDGEPGNWVAAISAVREVS